MKHLLLLTRAAALALLLPLAAQAQNVGIGTTAPTQPLDVNGNLRVRGLSGTDTRLLQVDATGNLSPAATLYPAAGVATGPLNPAPASTTTGLNNPLVAVSGPLAVVLNRGAGTLSLYDVSTPTAPVLRGTVPGITNGVEVAISGTTAAVLCNVTHANGTGLTKLYTLGSGAPTLANTLVPPAALSAGDGGIAMAGTLLYAIYDKGGSSGYFYVYDVTTPATAALLGTGNSGCYTPQAVAAAGTLAAVSSQYSGVAVLDVSNPAAPVVVGGTGCPGYNGGYDVPVAMTTSTLCLLSIGTSELKTYSLSAAGVPTLRSTYSTGASPVSVALSGSLAYVACRGTNALQVIDVSGASAVLRGTAALDATANNLALGANLLLAANGSPANDLQAFVLNGPRSVTVAADGTVGTVPLPSAGDYVQNQPASTQTGGFNLGGSGYLGARLGIGTTAPVARLDVRNAASSFPATSGTSQSTGHYARLADGTGLVLDLGGNGGNGNWLQSTNLTNLSLNLPLLLNPNGGNIGINTTGPARSLDIGSLTSAGSAMVRLGAGTTSGAARQWELGVQVNTANMSDVSGEYYDFAVRDATGGNTRLLVEWNTGNVGIGTTAPAQRLDVTGGNIRIGTSGNGLIFPDGSTQTTAATTATGAGFIQNQTTQQATSNFNISGAGTVGGALTAGSAAVAGALTGSGASITGVGVGIRADGGLNLGQNTTGTNLYVGYQAGRDNTTGANNHLVGVQAGQRNTTGSNNFMEGPGAGQQTTTGGGNLFMGWLAGQSGNGDRNLAIGMQAGRSNVASDNHFVGFYAGTGTSTGSRNTFEGNYTGVNNTTGAQNTFVGYQAGSDNSTGNNNLGVGYMAGPASGSGGLTNAGAIGYNARVSQSNSLVLGGTGANAVSVGIGTAAPSSTLQVAGTVAVGVALGIPGSSGGTALSGYPGGYLGLNPTSASTNNYFVLPDPATCVGRLYYLRNNSDTYSAYVGTAAGSIYGASSSTAIASNASYQLQPNATSKTVIAISDGVNWTIGTVN